MSEAPKVTAINMFRWFPRAAYGALIAGVLIGGFLYAAWWGAHAIDNPPIVYLDAKIVTPQVSVDGSVRFLVHARPAATRNCIGRVTREFYRPIQIDGVEMPLVLRGWGPTPIVIDGRGVYATDVELPRNITPGTWSFLAETTFDCGGGLIGGAVRRYQTTPVTFEVVAGNVLKEKP